MNSQSQMKQIGSGPCACACHKFETVSNNNPKSVASAEDALSATTPSQSIDLNAFNRPSMTTLHRMLHNREWEEIQDAIRKDASVAMRINDSLEEDRWFDEARRRKAVLEGVNNASYTNIGGAVVFGATKEGAGDAEERRCSKYDQEEDAPPMQLRYWVGNQSDNNSNPNNDFTSTTNIDANIRAKVDIQQKRTLLHSLCRMYFPSNEALIVQLTHGDSEGLKNLLGAVKTAQMLIEASHNNPIRLDDAGESSDESPSGVAMGGKTTNDGCSPHCNDCVCYFHRHYCPPVPLPPVERPQPARPDDQTELQAGIHSIHSEEDSELIQHTSALTMTDAMGESSLHALTGAGSCHVDLIQVFLEACRPLGETSNGHERERRPTVYDLLVSQNFHGCTPVHFLAVDSKNEEVLRSLLEQCQPLSADDRVHPTMICDNEGDLPLHFATCNGAPPSLLHTLTNNVLGDARSSMVRNSQGRLAVDDFIEWYMDSLGEHIMNQQVSEGDDLSEMESDDDSDGGESSSVSSNSSSTKKESGTFTNNTDNAHEGDFEDYVSCNFGFLHSATNWESELWDPLWVLIQAAATATRNSARNGQQTTVETQMQSDNNAWLPIHAAVIATKYANFPALTLAASIVRNGVGDDEDGNDEDRNCVSQRLTALLEEDCYGYLPLHWACGGDISSLLSSHPTSNGACVDMSDGRWSVQTCAHSNNSATALNEANRGPLNPSTSQCKELVRWNTKNLPTMIEYLLHCEPSAARIPTRQGRLPLHLLVEDGNSFNLVHTMLQSNEQDSGDDEFFRQPWDDIVAILKEFPDALGTPDTISHLYPFQLAAASLNPSALNPTQTCSTEPQSGLLPLENTYRLIMEDPSLLCQILEE